MERTRNAKFNLHNIYIFNGNFFVTHTIAGLLSREILDLLRDLKACLHCTLEPVSTDSGAGSARPH